MPSKRTFDDMKTTTLTRGAGRSSTPEPELHEITEPARTVCRLERAGVSRPPGVETVALFFDGRHAGGHGHKCARCQAGHEEADQHGNEKPRRALSEGRVEGEDLSVFIARKSYHPAVRRNTIAGLIAFKPSLNTRSRWKP